VFTGFDVHLGDVDRAEESGGYRTAVEEDLPDAGNGTDQIASFCFTLAIGIVALNPEV
jgi:hypothetical protein